MNKVYKPAETFMALVAAAIDVKLCAILILGIIIGYFLNPIINGKFKIF